MTTSIQEFTSGSLVVHSWPTSVAPAGVVSRRISVGAFYNRFGGQKWPILASADAMVRALILDSSVRAFIDLDDPDLPAGLAMIQAAGFPIDPEAIMTDEIHSDELPA